MSQVSVAKLVRRRQRRDRSARLRARAIADPAFTFARAQLTLTHTAGAIYCGVTDLYERQQPGLARGEFTLRLPPVAGRLSLALTSRGCPCRAVLVPSGSLTSLSSWTRVVRADRSPALNLHDRRQSVRGGASRGQHASLANASAWPVTKRSALLLLYSPSDTSSSPSFFILSHSCTFSATCVCSSYFQVAALAFG